MKARPDYLKRLVLTRIIKISISCAFSIWIGLVAAGNILDYSTNERFVRHVLEMDTTFPDSSLHSRSVKSESIQTLAYRTIIATQCVATLTCICGTLLMWFRRRDSYGFEGGALTSASGLTLIFFLYFVGFLGIGGEWFQMWQSSTWNGQNKAIGFSASAMLALLCVLAPEPD